MNPTRASRTWLQQGPTSQDPHAPHTATLLIDDVPVATAEGDDQATASLNLIDLLRERGIAVDGTVLAFDAFNRLVRQSRQIGGR